MKNWYVEEIDDTMPCRAAGKFMENLTEAEAKCIARHMNRKIYGLEIEAETRIDISYYARQNA